MNDCVNCQNFEIIEGMNVCIDCGNEYPVILKSMEYGYVGNYIAVISKTDQLLRSFKQSMSAFRFNEIEKDVLIKDFNEFSKAFDFKKCKSKITQ